MILKNESTIIVFVFIFLHLLIWTLVPAISNVNLPLDTIEALAWGSNLEWGYSKHPPVSALIVEINHFIFGSRDWAFYLLSQIFVVVSFYFIWKLSKFFFKDNLFPLLAILILEAIVFFNYTTPEFNVYVCQLPIKAVSVYFFWKAVSLNKILDWIILSISTSIGILTHYSFIFLIVSIFIYFIFFVKKNKKILTNFFFAISIFFLILTPHLIWLFENDFITFSYAITRTAIVEKNLLSHILNPLIFLLKQIGMLIFFIILFLSIFNFKKKINNLKKLDKKKFFLLSITLMPIILVLIVSLISGAKIRTMWMSTFYLFFGLFFFYFFKKKIDLKKINNFIYLFAFLFFLSPITYLYVSLKNDFKRTDYPGKEIARLVQNKWDDNFSNEINIVVGDEWSAGNLSYHLQSRPKWLKELKNEIFDIKDGQGVIYTGNPSILKQICPGVFGSIKPVGYCMIGKK